MNEEYRAVCQIHAAHHFRAAQEWSTRPEDDIRMGKFWAKQARYWATDGPHYTTCDKVKAYFQAFRSSRKRISAWEKGVLAYIDELLETLEQAEIAGDVGTGSESKWLELMMLNGARDWYQYSWGGSTLCYNHDIAKRLCNASTFVKKREGVLPPNAHEEWCDVQARALTQACSNIIRVWRGQR